MLDTINYIDAQTNWFIDQVDDVTNEVEILKPSQIAETKRYLPPGVSPVPGYYSFDLTPYWKEPLDCLSPQSPIREIDIMKGVQVGYTVGVIENGILYVIVHIKSAPSMLLTADAELAKLRLEGHIIKMLNASGLDHLIQSSDDGNTRKTGKTSKILEWIGGGFLVPFGAKNADKLRSIPIQYLWLDETDTYPERVGKDGKPNALAEDRTASYEETRKIVRGSTPLIEQTSIIYKEYLRGDQRKYMVPCRHCEEPQELRFEAGKPDRGIIYDLDADGNLIEESVSYVCVHCGALMKNADKSWMLPRGKWVPTATPESEDRRSYHISALYSPVGMQSWVTQVKKWLKAWDDELNRPRDMELLQQFYNNVLGWPFKMYGESLKLETVQAHRRPQYHSGEIPNRLAVEEAGGKIQLVTAAVDVHLRHIDILTIGWAPGGRLYGIDWEVFEGSGDDLEGDAWKKVGELIDNKVYEDENGRRYPIQTTMVDCGYNTNVVYEFCSRYESGVYPVMGRDLALKSATIKEFSEYTSKLGTLAFNITIGIYKDKLASAMKREWLGIGKQPEHHPNYPQEFSDEFFKQLSKEIKKEEKDARTGQVKGYRWHNPGQAPNHAWDLMVYNTAALDIMALHTCVTEFDIDYIDEDRFWEFCEREKYFFSE